MTARITLGGKYAGRTMVFGGIKFTDGVAIKEKTPVGPTYEFLIQSGAEVIDVAGEGSEARPLSELSLPELHEFAGTNDIEFKKSWSKQTMLTHVEDTMAERHEAANAAAEGLNSPEGSIDAALAEDAARSATPGTEGGREGDTSGAQAGVNPAPATTGTPSV